MPRFLQPNKSTQHRLAAIALYRALLSRCSSAALPDDDCVSLFNAIRNKFRRNRNLHSPAGVLARLVSQLPRGLTRPHRVRVFPQEPSEAKERLASLPPHRAVLNVRPYAKTSGPRHVPVIASANGIPFLRLTKPQPPALSRMLRQRLAKKIRVFDTKIMLGNWWLPMSKREDEWDAIVNMQTGSKVNGHDDGVRWVDAVRLSERENQEAYERDQTKERMVTRKMQKIVDLETELALKEGRTITRGRNRRPISVLKPNSKP
ncbi:hypothetical protein CC86DRAFT_389366 [Ophiobolus disseminans]|uniref:Uncharacterized protein n=1 Tax=Ophiobolus disseminans TaxID=1469910 RepID=A0A6A7AI32_9PLEO|nr:hypothetical protein CC86DRAFT_389366 [Ophiobolus disseminans]